VNLGPDYQTVIPDAGYQRGFAAGSRCAEFPDAPKGRHSRRSATFHHSNATPTGVPRTHRSSWPPTKQPDCTQPGVAQTPHRSLTGLENLSYGRLVGLTLRQWQSGDDAFLWDMLFEAIYVADGEPQPSRSILNDPSIAHYLTDFGAKAGDDAVIAWDDGRPIGAAFCRRFSAENPSYGFVSADVPEVGMAVISERRGEGIGRALLMWILDRHLNVSLSVHKENARARRLYESLGFVDLHSDGTSVTMLRQR